MFVWAGVIKQADDSCRMGGKLDQVNLLAAVN